MIYSYLGLPPQRAGLTSSQASISSIAIIKKLNNEATMFSKRSLILKTSPPRVDLALIAVLKSMLISAFNFKMISC